VPRMYDGHVTVESRASRRRWRVRISGLLLASQASLAALTGLVHAGESLTAPIGIEAEHGRACVVVHDSARCPSCQLSGVATMPRATRAPAAIVATWSSAPAAVTLSPAHQRRRTAQSRAPPVLPV